MKERQAFHRSDSATFRLFTRPPDWMEHAACANPKLDPDLWFPNNGRVPEAARNICNYICPVQAECLAYGLRDPNGIWGGVSETERATMSGTRLRKPEPLKSPTCNECGLTFRNARARAGHAGAVHSKRTIKQS